MVCEKGKYLISCPDLVKEKGSSIHQFQFLLEDSKRTKIETVS